MSGNISQIGQCPSESSILNREHQSDIDQLLSMETVATTPQPPPPPTTTTNQSSSSSIQLNPTDMVANVQQHNNETPRQNARQGEQPYQHQQQLQQQQQQRQQQQQVILMLPPSNVDPRLWNDGYSSNTRKYSI